MALRWVSDYCQTRFDREREYPRLDAEDDTSGHHIKIEEPNRYGKICYEFYFEVEPRKPVDLVMPDFQPQPHIGARQILALVKEWFEKCEESHTFCKSMRTKNWRPSRLIHWGATTNDLVVIHEAIRYDENVRYATLSHRWTPEEQVLRTSNIEDFREGFPLATLKASIRDAVTFADHLGCRYLWVDTLCVIQDDSYDQEKQICQMDKVYSNAVCNIAASDATHSNEGCFFDRRPETQYASVWLGKDTSEQMPHILRSHRSRTRSTVLDGRAWVMQEKILAPRTVHCGRTEVSWECREMQASENNPVGSNRQSELTEYSMSIHVPPLEVLFKGIWGRGVDVQSQGDDISRRDHWKVLVENYTSRKLTFSRDRLQAMAGIIATWQKLHSGECIAESPAPTWSWASVDGTVAFVGTSQPRALGYMITENTLAKLAGIELSPPKEAPNGGVHWSYGHAILHLFGRLSRVYWDEPRESKGLRLSLTEDIKFDAIDVYRCGAAPRNEIILDDNVEAVPEIVHCFLIDINGWPDRALGLLLTPAAAGTMQFYRIGFFQAMDGCITHTLFNAPEVVVELG
ncbi:hypothetical protein LTR17_008532 [Elasticomyces elasticus]|nr:hypothetical protein LTR17_008532 [Elasticomyces elasticus]